MHVSITFNSYELGLMSKLSELAKVGYNQLVDRIERSIIIDRKNLCKHFETRLFAFASDYLSLNEFEQFSQFVSHQAEIEEIWTCCEYHKKYKEVVL